MRVELFPADQAGCGLYRMVWPAEAVTAQHPEIEVVVHHADSTTANLPALMQQQADGAHVVGLGKRDWPDVIVFQRPLNRFLAEMIPQLQRIGVAVVVELDDDFAHLDPQHSVFKSVQPRNSPQRNWRHLQAACMMADIVTVSTKQLARTYGHRGNATVIRNYVPASYLDLPISKMEDGPRFVWSGSLDAHPRDLQVTRGAVGRVMRGASFDVIGPGTGVQEALALPKVPIVRGYVPLAEYAAVVAEYDVMLAPLDLTPFNHAKSWLKGLEAAAVGLDVIASPTEQYRELAELGMCELAAKPQRWEATIKDRIQRLAVSGYREEVAERQRGIVRSAGLTIEERSHERVLAWRHALSSRVRSRA